MLEIRPVCENCNKPLPVVAADAMICSYECTFCTDCVTNVLHNVCPNCGGGFEKRPVRPKNGLLRNPATTKVTYKPVDIQKYAPLLAKNLNIPAAER
jgi:hypothetical protein